MHLRHRFLIAARDVREMKAALPLSMEAETIVRTAGAEEEGMRP